MYDPKAAGGYLLIPDLPSPRQCYFVSFELVNDPKWDGQLPCHKTGTTRVTSRYPGRTYVCDEHAVWAQEWMASIDVVLKRWSTGA